MIFTPLIITNNFVTFLRINYDSSLNTFILQKDQNIIKPLNEWNPCFLGIPEEGNWTIQTINKNDNSIKNTQTLFIKEQGEVVAINL